MGDNIVIFISILLSTLCDLEQYRVTQSIVAELKITGGVRYPKEIPRNVLSQNVNKIQFQKAKIRLTSWPYFNITFLIQKESNSANFTLT